jgi:hypothetical protein
MVAVFLAIAAYLAGPARSPTSSGEAATSAAMLLRMLAASQVMFASSCGNGGYARTFDQLATPPPGSSDGFFDHGRLDRIRRTYTVALLPAATGPTDCNGHPTSGSFTATAVPLNFDKFARRSFTLDPSGRLWYSESRTAPTEPFEKTGKPLN